MSRRVAAWLAWSLAGLSAAMFVGGIALYVLARVAQSPDDPAAEPIGKLLIYVPFLAFPIVGALIASRRLENPIGWMCLVAGLFWMLIALGREYDAYVLAKLGSVPGAVMIDALTQWIWVPPVAILAIYMILLFPDGRLPSRRWRP